MKFSNVVMSLRQCANHPYLFQRQLYDIDHTLISISGKFCFLDRLLPKMKRFNHRTLLFCQMTMLLDIVEEYFRFRGVKYLRLDGNVKNEQRQERLEPFTDPNSEIDVFIISTRAGGLGLNLQAADTVIIFDSDWNPSNDLQAQSRAHRIGQTKEVRVFRLITSQTVEELVYTRGLEKLKLTHEIIDKGKFDQTSSQKQRKSWQKEALFKKPLEQTSLKVYGENVNKLLARSDEELKAFNEMDAQAKKYDWVSVDFSETVPKWLALPDLKALREQELNTEYGKGKRKKFKRKRVDFEEESAGEEPPVKRKRKKKKRKRAKGNFSEEETLNHWSTSMANRSMSGRLRDLRKPPMRQTFVRPTQSLLRHPKQTLARPTQTFIRPKQSLMRPGPRTIPRKKQNHFSTLKRSKNVVPPALTPCFPTWAGTDPFPIKKHKVRKPPGVIVLE